MDKQSFVKLRINRMMLITFVIAMVTVFGWIDPVQCAAEIGFAKNVTNMSICLISPPKNVHSLIYAYLML